MTVDGWEEADHSYDEKVVDNGYSRCEEISQVLSLRPVPDTDGTVEITIMIVITITKWSSRGCITSWKYSNW